MKSINKNEDFKQYCNTRIWYYSCIFTDDEIVERTILAKIAQDALQIKGIKASFVIGMIDHDIIQISARSNGSVNVQLLIEKMGGGGHFSAAAAQISNSTISQVNERLKDVINLYLDEVSGS